MSRVCVFMPSLVGGGAERVTLDLCRGLAARGHEVTLVLAHAQGELRGELDDAPAGLRLLDLRRRRTAGGLVALARHLRAAQPEVVVGVLPHAGLVALAAGVLARCRAHYVVMVHNQLSVSVRHSPRARDRLVPLLCRVGFRRADTVTAVSHGVADDFAATTGVPRRRVTVLPNPIDFERIRRRGEEPLPSWWGTAGDSRTVVAAGRLTEQKDFASLLDAFARLAAPGTRLVILGEGPERARLEAQVVRLGLTGQVLLPGYVENPFPLFRAADAFVLSSRWEGLPTVLLEVLAFETPVVSTDCPSGPREILDGGRYGALVPVADPAALADALRDALGGHQTHHDRRAIHESFALEAVTERFAGLW